MKNILSLRTAVLFTSVFVIILFFLSASSFAQITVKNLNDSGPGSLRQAIIDANGMPGPDEIVFQGYLFGPLSLEAPSAMTITDDLTITGPGADVVTIDAQTNGRIFIVGDVDSGDIVVSISGLRFINGRAPDDSGAIFNRGELSLDSCWFENNKTTLRGNGRGGAIWNAGTIEQITNSTFIGNSAELGGGAIVNAGIITEITDSTFSGNSADFGGAIFNDSGTIEQITNSTFSGNSAGFRDGGAIWNAGTIQNITNSTFSGNSAADAGGAIYNAGTITEITNSTFSGNSAGSAIFNDSGTINVSFTTIAGNSGGGLFLTDDESIRLRNTILADNTPENCAGSSSNAPLDTGGNYSDDITCGFTPPSSRDYAFIILGPLADNGGPTQTRALLDGDPIDGASANCDPLDSMGMPTGMPIGLDQRYFTRPFGPDCDSGAYEAGSSVPEGPEEPEGPPGPSGSSCAVVGSSSGHDGLGGLLVYALIPLAIVIRRRFMDRRSQHRDK